MTTSLKATQAERQSLTVDEYLSLPTDGPPTELILGEVIMSPRATERHNDLLHNLGTILDRWTRHHDLGKVAFDIDMVLDTKKRLVYAPDLLFVAKEHDERRRKGRVYGPADLCVEILSPSDRPYVQGRKLSDYERHGVPWYWTIDPTPNKLAIEEYELVEGNYVCRTQVEGDAWFEPALFPELIFRLSPLLEGNPKAAVKGKGKKLM